MRIKSVRIQNLRSIRDETISFDGYTCFVGANGAGKSTVLFALNVFFRDRSGSPTEVAELSEQDFHAKNTSDPIRITVTLGDLSKEAQEDFKDYFRQGQLVISAEAIFDTASNRAPVRQLGQRMGMEEFRPFFEAHGGGLAVAVLKEIFKGLRVDHPDLTNASTKDAMADSLRAYEAANPNRCVLIPSEDQFYGVSRGANRLEKYLQWVFVPAVKDACDEQLETKDTALGKLLARTVRSKVSFSSDLVALRKTTLEAYSKLLESRQSDLTSLSDSLQARLANWAHPETGLKVEWKRDADRSVKLEDPIAQVVAGEHGFEGELSRFGHGLQRSYLIALLQELSGAGLENSPRLLLALEEPELFQHPPQARYLAEILKSLPEGNAQVIVCTHSPFFVDGGDFEKIRLVRKPIGASSTSIKSVDLNNLSSTLSAATGKKREKLAGVKAKIHQSLQPSLNEIFFAPFIVLVEGLEDVAYITAYAHLVGVDREFRKRGVHIVPTNGKNHLIHPIAICDQIGIPAFVVFDSDAHETDEEKRQKHETDNSAILKLCGVGEAPSMPTESYWGSRCVMWASEMGKAVASDYSPEELIRLKDRARCECGHVKGLEKNSLFIGEFLSEAFAAGMKSPTLEKLCHAILTFTDR